MLKGIKAFLLSVLTVGSLVATGNMVKEETKVAEAATDYSKTIRIYWNGGNTNAGVSWGGNVRVSTSNSSKPYYFVSTSGSDTQGKKYDATLGSLVVDITSTSTISYIQPEFTEWEVTWKLNVTKFSKTFTPGYQYIITYGAYTGENGSTKYFSATCSEGTQIPTDAKTFTIKYYDANGKSLGSGSQKFSTGSLFKGDFFEKTGKFFEGWYLDQSLTKKLENGTAITNDMGDSTNTIKLYGKYYDGVSDQKQNTFRVYVENTRGWARVSIHVWADKIDGHTTDWPGLTMTKLTGYSNPTIYYYDLDYSKSYDSIIFNNGTPGDDSSATEQTVNTDLMEVYSFNEKEKIVDVTKKLFTIGAANNENKYACSLKNTTSLENAASTKLNTAINSAVAELQKYIDYSSVDAKQANHIGKSNRDTIKSTVTQAIKAQQEAVEKAVDDYKKTPMIKYSEDVISVATTKFNGVVEQLQNGIDKKIEESNLKVYAQSQALDNGDFNIRFWGTVDDLGDNKYSALGFKIVAKMSEKQVEAEPIYINSIYTSISYTGKEKVTCTADEFDTTGFFLYMLTNVPSTATDVEFEVTPFAKRMNEDLTNEDYGLTQTFKFVSGQIQRVAA